MCLFRTALLLALLHFAIWLPIAAAATLRSPTATLEKTHALPDQTTLRSWIEQIKESPRGPFKRIRWFCNDGTILPPEPYACREHGGGVQHGEWTERVKQLRQNNYLIATLLADLSRESFYALPDWQDRLKQIILEQFLREADDGWIFRRASYYRGAVQAEDENGHGRSLLLGLLQQPELRDRHFLLLREAVHFLPHGQNSPSLTAMRHLAQRIAEQDTDFGSLRIKLHSLPEAVDAARVRDYAITGRKELQSDYRQLAALIDELSKPPLDPYREALRLQLTDTHLEEMREPTEIVVDDHFAWASQLLAKIRKKLPRAPSDDIQLQWLDLSDRLEFELFRTANQLLAKLPTASRRQQLDWIALGIDGLYGTGMLSNRERDSLNSSLKILRSPPLSLENYQRELSQLARLSRWAENRLRYHFENPLMRLSRLDTRFRTFIPERLRGSPLLPISRMIDNLQADSRQLRGVSHHLFGAETSGLQPLNPGLARGKLEIVADPRQHDFSAEGIYLLPETVENLPPVAGILSRGIGNSLSHIQLLARNLGIPNISLDESLLTEFARHQGETILVAVSPGGVVRIDVENENQQKSFNRNRQQPDFQIEADRQKLDLQQTAILRLDQLRAGDSGRIAGPKGANLGELKRLYPQLVPDALVIPFGRFHQFLEQTRTPDGQTLLAWMRSHYQRLAERPDVSARNKFLRRLREQIISAPLEQGFLDELRTRLQTNFGADGSYGVFVRSDTNVEDLPNFTGAGLNKTVPHVVGFANIVRAIRTVWASPFSDRAFSWRQTHMRAPEQLYVSVVLMASVAAEKSGVMATIDLSTGSNRYVQVATNEGVGGAVSGQRAEEVLIDSQGDRVRLLTQTSADRKHILLPQGGIKKIQASAPEQLLSTAELRILRQMAAELPRRFPDLRNPDGSSKPADIEFGFQEGKFILFQIRPLVESTRLKNDLLLQELDAGLVTTSTTVDLEQSPAVRQP